MKKKNRITDDGPINWRENRDNAVYNIFAANKKKEEKKNAATNLSRYKQSGRMIIILFYILLSLSHTLSSPVVSDLITSDSR